MGHINPGVKKATYAVTPHSSWRLRDYKFDSYRRTLLDLVTVNQENTVITSCAIYWSTGHIQNQNIVKDKPSASLNIYYVIIYIRTYIYIYIYHILLQWTKHWALILIYIWWWSFCSLSRFISDGLHFLLHFFNLHFLKTMRPSDEMSDSSAVAWAQ